MNWPLAAVQVILAVMVLVAQIQLLSRFRRYDYRVRVRRMRWLLVVAIFLHCVIWLGPLAWRLL